MEKKVQELITEGILALNVIDGVEVVQLAKSTEIHMNKHETDKISAMYKHNREEGGLFLCKPILMENGYILKVEEVKFISNRSNTPERQYMKDRNEYIEALNYAYMKEYLPIDFHTHPTSPANPFMYYEQIDTSNADKEASKYSNPLGKFRFNLPDALIVQQADLNKTLVIGFYGANIPLDFTQQKHDNIASIGEKIMEKIEDSQSPWTPVLIIGGVVFLGYLAMKNPKLFWALLLSLGISLPIITAGSNGLPIYFSTVGTGETKISIPIY